MSTRKGPASLRSTSGIVYLATISACILDVLALDGAALAEKSVPLPDDPVSPQLRIDRKDAPSPEAPRGTGVRSISGSGNNSADETMGAANTMLRRLAPPDYPDLIAAMGGPNRRSARQISNLVAAETRPRVNALGASDFVWQWGQFLDHDIDLTDGTEPPGAIERGLVPSTTICSLHFLHLSATTRPTTRRS